jgi:hypothetical protein
MNLPDAVMLATEDTDLGLVPGEDAISIARTFATSTSKTVYVRDPTTDRILRRVHPSADIIKLEPRHD